MGGKFATTIPTLAQDVKHSALYCADGDYLIVFCADNQCLKIDSEVSKVRQIKKGEAPSRDGKGNMSQERII